MRCMSASPMKASVSARTARRKAISTFPLLSPPAKSQMPTPSIPAMAFSPKMQNLQTSSKLTAWPLSALQRSISALWAIRSRRRKRLWMLASPAFPDLRAASRPMKTLWRLPNRSASLSLSKQQPAAADVACVWRKHLKNLKRRFPPRSKKPSRLLAMAKSILSATSQDRATSKFRYWRTLMAMLSIWANGTALYSAATKKF